MKKRKRKIKMYKIVFASGGKIAVPVFNSYVLYQLQESNRESVVTVDGVPTALWGMTKHQIKKEKKRMKDCMAILDEAWLDKATKKTK